MSCRILNIKSPADAEAEALFRRLSERGNPADGNGQDVENQVRAILADVRERGDQALIERTRQFDAPDMELPLAVPQEELARAMAHGITDGTRPGGYATREEVALMAERAYSGRA